MTEPAPVYCINHPGVETSLRCKTCGAPICARCAVLTPTGYSCKTCLRTIQKRFETARWYDFVLGALAAFFLSFLTSLLISFIATFTFFIIWLIVVAAASSISAGIAEVLRFVTGKRRSRALFVTLLVAFILGAVPILLLNLFNWIGLVFQVIYLVVGTPIIYYRLSGIHLR